MSSPSLRLPARTDQVASETAPSSAVSSTAASAARSSGVPRPSTARSPPSAADLAGVTPCALAPAQCAGPIRSARRSGTAVRRITNSRRRPGSVPDQQRAAEAEPAPEQLGLRASVVKMCIGSSVPPGERSSTRVSTLVPLLAGQGVDAGRRASAGHGRHRRQAPGAGDVARDDPVSAGAGTPSATRTGQAGGWPRRAGRPRRSGRSRPPRPRRRSGPRTQVLAHLLGRPSPPRPAGRRSARARRPAARPIGPHCARALALRRRLAQREAGAGHGGAVRAHRHHADGAGRRPGPRHSARTGTPISSITSISVSAGARLGLAAVDAQGDRFVALGVERHELGRDPGRPSASSSGPCRSTTRCANSRRASRSETESPSRHRMRLSGPCSLSHARSSIPACAPSAVRVALHRREPDIEVARLEASHR